VSLLQIERLKVEIGRRAILSGVDLVLEQGEILGMVGESGSGKSMTALAIMGLLPEGAVAAGSIRFDGNELVGAYDHKMQKLRGDDIGMVFQEPMTALNPVKTIGEQVAEGIRWHRGVSRADAEAQAAAMLDRVGLPPARFPLHRYPHQLSGGQRQRVVVAIACALNPRLLIADEPTTALDVVLQAQLLDLLRDLVRERKMAMLLISHDLAVVTEMADRIAVMRNGAIVDEGETATLLSRQEHPYTRQLAYASTHVPARPAHRHVESGAETPLLQVYGVTREYSLPRKSLLGPRETLRAVEDVSLSIGAGKSVALVGRSGCGKSTLARVILCLDRPSAGSVRFEGKQISNQPETAIRAARRNMQVVFQDPYGSFDPRRKVEWLVTEPLHLLDVNLDRASRRQRAAQALHEVGLSESDLDKYPHEFSGGQRQRLSIARAIITRPRLVVADEPVSALDVSIRAQVLDLFADLNARAGIAFLFITHDLTLARAITDEVLVMHEGQIVERGATAEILREPQSEPARALVAAAPDLRRSLARRIAEQG